MDDISNIQKLIKDINLDYLDYKINKNNKNNYKKINILLDEIKYEISKIELSLKPIIYNN